MEKNIQKNQSLKDKINSLNTLLSKTNLKITSNKNLLKKAISDNFSKYTKKIFFDFGRKNIYL